MHRRAIHNSNQARKASLTILMFYYCHNKNQYHGHHPSPQIASSLPSTASNSYLEALEGECLRAWPVGARMTCDGQPIKRCKVSDVISRQPKSNGCMSGEISSLFRARTSPHPPSALVGSQGPATAASPLCRPASRTHPGKIV